jgi:hypothetical protein
MKEMTSSTDALQAYLIDKLGSAEFAHVYESVRNALALGKDFKVIRGVAAKNLKDLFPLLIQLIQMQCCTKL